MRTEQTISTSNLALCAALATMGIPFDDPAFFKTRSHRGEQYLFFVKPVSECGSYQTSDLMEAWHDPDFVKDHPEHPFSYIKQAFQNRESLLDKVNQAAALVVVERNGKLAILSEHASAETQDKIFGQL
jgi:hypothetical protein